MLKQRKKPQRLQITERDLAIFESLSTARFLTAQALEWLHFPDWEARYKAWQERGKDAGPYGPSVRGVSLKRKVAPFAPRVLHTAPPHKVQWSMRSPSAHCCIEEQ